MLAEALRALDLAHVELEAARDQLREQADELLATRLEHELAWTRYRDLFEAAPLPYIETDHRGVVIEANRCLSTFLRVPPGGLIGQPIIAFVALSDRRVFRNALESIVAGSPSVSIFVHVHPRGSVAHVATWVEIAKVVPPGDRSETVRWMFAKSHERERPPAAELGTPSLTPNALRGATPERRSSRANCRRAGRCVRCVRIPRRRHVREQ